MPHHPSTLPPLPSHRYTTRPPSKMPPYHRPPSQSAHTPLRRRDQSENGKGFNNEALIVCIHTPLTAIHPPTTPPVSNRLTPSLSSSPSSSLPPPVSSSSATSSSEDVVDRNLTPHPSFPQPSSAAGARGHPAHTPIRAPRCDTLQRDTPDVTATPAPTTRPPTRASTATRACARS